ncbi:hypothetical protein DPMN_168991 [Dreissena polymorpha]|uniref:Uncharacterized protein n=1 Tax=Dreissena polymorpha TaxID=45954 RepID=A0A9D4F3U3_DREPO|nr:hypothetical protein DPMN_168991 [Dreissena polymorpha]
MAINNKGVTCEAGTIYDTDLIYGIVIGLMSSRSVDLKKVLSHQRSTVPSSMFDNNGNMKIATPKATLTRKLHVTQSARLSSTPDTIVIDGCAVLWCIHWPAMVQCRIL